jgi:coenzyme F420 hydrogenase subunit delta
MQSLNGESYEVIVLGCGNILFGDDGFGSCVTEYLQNEVRIPGHVSVVGARTSVRGILFDIMLDEHRPRRIIIVDAVDAGRKPGEVFNLSIDDFPVNKIDDFSFHQMPTSNLLRELRDYCNVEVIIIVAQVESIPEEVKPGLSKALMDSVVIAADEVLRACG